jgi:mono/diheme cytochrome c family protein
VLTPLVLAGTWLFGASVAPAAAPPTAPDLALGEKVYARWCVHCHAAGRGNPGTQSLQVKYGDRVPAVLLERTDLTPEAVTLFTRQGVLSMPPFRKTEITDAELAALAPFVARKPVRP